MNDHEGNTELEPDVPFIPAPAPLQVDDVPGVPTNKSWSVGTLTYTRAGLTVLFCLLLWGDFAWSMKERSAASILQVLVKAFHASDSEMQLFMVVIPNAISVFLAPVVSFRSDRYRSRWGRRIPFLMVSTPFAVLAMMGLGYSPSMGQALHGILGRHSPGLNASTRLFFGVFWVVFEVATVAANSVFGGLINDTVPKQFLGRFYGLFRAFSLLAGMIFNFGLFGLAEVHYRSMFIGIGLLYGLGFTFMCLTVREGQYPGPVQSPSNEDTSRRRSSGVIDYRSDLQSRGLLNSMKVYMRECFSNPYYIWVTVAITLGTLTFMPVNNFSQPFAKSLHIDNDIYGKYLFATYAISLGMSFFLGDLADRLHPLRIGIAAMALYAIITFWGEFYAARTVVLFNAHYSFRGVTHVIPVHLFAIAFIGHGVISGTYFTCTASLTQRLLPHERFAQFASAGQVLLAICSIFFALFTGWFFDHYGHVYRHTYLMGFILSLAGVFTMLKVHRGFMRYGGMKAYVAP